MVHVNMTFIISGYFPLTVLPVSAGQQSVFHFLRQNATVRFVHQVFVEVSEIQPVEPNFRSSSTVTLDSQDACTQKLTMQLTAAPAGLFVPASNQITVAAFFPDRHQHFLRTETS